MVSCVVPETGGHRTSVLYDGVLGEFSVCAYSMVDSVHHLYSWAVAWGHAVDESSDQASM